MTSGAGGLSFSDECGRHGIVVPPPAFDDDPCLLKCIEDFSVERFVAEFGIEAFAVTVL